MASRTHGQKYGTRHQQLRRRWARAVADGHVACWRCGLPIDPSDPWHLGHDDRDDTTYRGPEHVRCNTATASHRPPRRRPIEPHPGDIA